MTPFHADEWATIYRADALAVLAHLPTHSVDAVVTDPPYSSGGMVRGDRMGSTAAKYVNSDSGNQSISDFTGDTRDQRAYAYWSALWMGEALRATKPGGVLLAFTDWRQLPATTDAIQSGGWVWRGIVPWYKPVARPQLGRFTASCEYVVWGSNGGMPIDYHGGGSALPGFYQANSPREREHQTQKPLEVMRKMVQIAPEGGIILDPFMGSGTTGVASVIEGRRFIGSELVDEYADISRTRILKAQLEAVPTLAGQAAFDLTELEEAELEL